MGRSKVVVSWSGGKDCCLALHRLLESEDESVGLLSMVSEKDARNRSHGIPLPWLELQAQALGLPLFTVDSGDAYGLRLTDALRGLREERGADAVAFGSLYSERDRGWNEGIASATVCRARQDVLDRSWAGRVLDQRFFEDIHQTKSCPMGENGEFHTSVTDDPAFKRRLEIRQSAHREGAQLLHSNSVLQEPSDKRTASRFLFRVNEKVNAYRELVR